MTPRTKISEDEKTWYIAIFLSLICPIIFLPLLLAMILCAIFRAIGDMFLNIFVKIKRSHCSHNWIQNGHYPIDGQYCPKCGAWRQ